MTQAEKEQDNGKEKEKERDKEKEKEQQRGVKRPIAPPTIPDPLQEVRGEGEGLNCCSYFYNVAQYLCMNLYYSARGVEAVAAENYVMKCSAITCGCDVKVSTYLTCMALFFAH